MLIVDTPVGKLRLEAAAGKLVSCAFLRGDRNDVQEGKPDRTANRTIGQTVGQSGGLSGSPADVALLKRAAKQIDDYFSGSSTTFNLPLGVPANQTPFREKVWAAMRKIPYGVTTTYGELAKTLSTAPRAVGGACRSNPLILITPCHRVVATGGIGGFSGEWKTGLNVEIKKKLLDIEAG